MALIHTPRRLYSAAQKQVTRRASSRGVAAVDEDLVDFAFTLPCLIATWMLSGLCLSLGPSLAAPVLSPTRQTGVAAMPRRPPGQTTQGSSKNCAGPGPNAPPGIAAAA